MSLFQQAKLVLVDHTGLAKDALHIHVALGLYLGAAALTRWPLRDWRLWTLVLVAALAGEIWDLIDSHVYHTPIVLAANVKDVVNTMFWPTVISMLARWTSLLRRR